GIRHAVTIGVLGSREAAKDGPAADFFLGINNFTLALANVVNDAQVHGIAVEGSAGMCQDEFSGFGGGLGPGRIAVQARSRVRPPICDCAAVLVIGVWTKPAVEVEGGVVVASQILAALEEVALHEAFG